MGETVIVPHDIVRGTNNFVLRISGDGLECEQMRDGDFVIVSPEADALQKDALVVVEVPDVGGKRIRRIHQTEHGTVCLEIGHSAALYMAESVRIVGVVVGIIRKY
jgi:SOS-response transcriptional repressor LexA